MTAKITALTAKGAKCCAKGIKFLVFYVQSLNHMRHVRTFKVFFFRYGPKKNFHEFYMPLNGPKTFPISPFSDKWV